VVLAVVFTLLAAVWGIGVGFILTFLQSLTSPNAAPIQTGVDIWILGAMLLPLSGSIGYLILLTTLIRLSFTYLGPAISLSPLWHTSYA